MTNKVPFEAFVLTVLMLAIGIRYCIVVNATPSTIVVSPGLGAIQGAINAAKSGDVIRVTNGTYYENLIVNKSVSIIGDGPADTVIDGGGRFVMNIIESNVVVSGFAIQNENQGNSFYAWGLTISSCNSVVVNDTVLRNNYYGLQLTNASDCEIFNDTIVNSSYAGIYIPSSCSGNVFFGNSIEDNNIGLSASNSPSNTFYDNNFINNRVQCSALPPVTLDNDVIKEGNYWSGYEGSYTNLTNLTGVWDSQFVNGSSTDSYPLMGMFTNFTVNYKGRSYFLSTICNSTISNFEFNESSEKIEFDVIGRNDTMGFCRIDIPLTLIQNGCTILVDGKVPVFGKNWNTSAYGYRCFVYANTGATSKVTVELGPRGGGTSLSFMVPVLIAVSLVVIVLVLITLARGGLGKKIRKFPKKQS